MASKLTLKDAKRMVSDLGLTLIERDDEFIVKAKGLSIDAASTYFTNDLQDAVDTARSMSSKRSSPPRRVDVVREHDSRRKVVGLMLASAPCTASEIRRELLEQCLGVYTSNVQAVYVAAMDHLISTGTVERESDGENDVFDFTDTCFDINGHYCGPYDE